MGVTVFQLNTSYQVSSLKNARHARKEYKCLQRDDLQQILAEGINPSAKRCVEKARCSSAQVQEMRQKEQKDALLGKLVGRDV